MIVGTIKGGKGSISGDKKILWGREGMVQKGKKKDKGKRRYRGGKITSNGRFGNWGRAVGKRFYVYFGAVYEGEGVA